MLNRVTVFTQYQTPLFKTQPFPAALLQKHRCCVEPRTSLSALEVRGAYRTGCPAYLQKVVDTHSFVGIITQQLSNSATQQLSNSATQQLRRKVCLRPEKRAAFLFRQQHHYFFSSFFADGTSGARVFTFTHRRCFTALGIFCALGMQRIRSCKHIINTAFYRRSRPAVWFDNG